MRISRTLMVVCAGAACCAITLSVRGVDNEAQAKAREALRKKMQELPANCCAASTAGKAISTPAPADSEAIAKARAAVRQKCLEMEQASGKLVTAWNPPADSEAIAKARAAARQKISELVAQETTGAMPAISSPGPVADPAGITKARESVRETMIDLIAQEKEKTPVHALSRPVSLGFPPIEGPALTISAEKQQRLNSLLRKYKADEITPEQYHAERAKLLAEQ